MGASTTARKILEQAANRLFFAKLRQDRTPWRELVATYKAGEPGRVEVEVIDFDGSSRMQVIYGEPGFGLKGDAAWLFEAGEEFTLALDMVEAEREANRLAGLGGGRPSIDRSNIKTALNTLIKRHGRDKLLAKPVSWILERLRDELSEAAAADQPQPSDNILRSEIADALPGHPKLNRKKIFNNGGS
jgi:hypothetical protein